MGFEDLKICAVINVFRKRDPHGGSGNWEGSVSPDPVLGSEWWWQEVGIRGTDAAGRNVVVEPVGEVARGLVVKGLQITVCR